MSVTTTAQSPRRKRELNRSTVSPLDPCRDMEVLKAMGRTKPIWLMGPDIYKLGTPVVETGESSMTGWRGTLVEGSVPDRICVQWHNNEGMTFTTSPTGGTRLDTTTEQGNYLFTLFGT